MKNSLPIYRKNPINLYPQYALKLVIILNDPHFTDWFMQKFVCNYGFVWRDELYWSYYNEDFNNFANELFEIYKYEQDDFNESSLITAIKKAIDDEFYIIIQLDDQTIRMNDLVSIHQYLIYGYDDEKQEFLVYGYNKNIKMSEKQFPYKIVADAFFCTKNAALKKTNGTSGIQYMEKLKLKSYSSPYTFQLETFYKDLCRFIQSEVDFNAVQNVWGCIPPVFAGMKLNELYCEMLYKNNFNLSFVYSISEHRKGLLTRFQYLSRMFLHKEFDEKINEFKQITRKYEICEYMCIKDGVCYKTITKETADRVARIFTQATNEEIRLLPLIADIIYSFINNQLDVSNHLRRQSVIFNEKGNELTYLFTHAINLSQIQITNAHRYQDLQVSAIDSQGRSHILQKANDSGKQRFDAEICGNPITEIVENREISSLILNRNNPKNHLDQIQQIHVVYKNPLSIVQDLHITEKNLLDDAKISASSFWSNESYPDFFGPQHVLTEDSMAWVVAKGRSIGEYITCIFPCVKTFDTLYIQQAAACLCIRGFKLQVKKDSGIYEDVYECKQELGFGMKKFRFQPSKGKEIRFLITDTTTDRDPLPGLSFLKLV